MVLSLYKVLKNKKSEIEKLQIALQDEARQKLGIVAHGPPKHPHHHERSHPARNDHGEYAAVAGRPDFAGSF